MSSLAKASSVLRTKSLSGFQNTNELQNNKPEKIDEKPIISGSVPPTGRFYEPFLRDLELIWKTDELVKNCIDS
jgi:hypothetical protein